MVISVSFCKTENNFSSILSYAIPVALKKPFSAKLTLKYGPELPPIKSLQCFSRYLKFVLKLYVH